MDRRAFLELLAAAPLASAVRAEDARAPPTGSSAATLRRPYPACRGPGRGAWCHSAPRAASTRRAWSSTPTSCAR